MVALGYFGWLKQILWGHNKWLCALSKTAGVRIASSQHISDSLCCEGVILTFAPQRVSNTVLFVQKGKVTLQTGYNATHSIEHFVQASSQYLYIRSYFGSSQAIANSVLAQLLVANHLRSTFVYRTFVCRHAAPQRHQKKTTASQPRTRRWRL